MSTSVAGSPRRGAAVVDLLTALYPPPFTVDLTGGRGSVKAQWSAIPSAANPKLLVPIGRGPAAARTLRRQLTGRRMRTRVARAGLTIATGSGALSRLPGLLVTVAGPLDAPSIEDPLREVLGVDQVRLTLPIGPARSNRKPVLQVTDPSGHVLAFAKIGHTPLTARLVRQEAGTLVALDADPVEGVRSPRVMGSLTWGGYDVLVLEPLAIPSRRLTGEPGRRRLVRLVHDVARVDGLVTIPWADHPYRPALLSRITHCGDLAGPLWRQLERIHPERPLVTGAWHGDLNPGNLALLPGNCPVWDWERFESGVPLGFDLLHHDLHESITIRGVPAGAAAEHLLRGAGSTLAPLGMEPSEADAVARAYLVTLACRYLADDQRGAGADLGRVDEWLIPALDGVGS